MIGSDRQFLVVTQFVVYRSTIGPTSYIHLVGNIQSVVRWCPCISVSWPSFYLPSAEGTGYRLHVNTVGHFLTSDNRIGTRILKVYSVHLYTS